MRFRTALLLAASGLACAQTHPDTALAGVLRASGAAAGACFQSTAGRFYFGSDVEESPGPSWLILAHFGTAERAAADSGLAYLFDRHAPTEPTPLRWIRQADSIDVGWEGNFGGWHAQLEPGAMAISGMATWHTDERELDSATGVWRSRPRRWAVWARRVTCDSVPLRPARAT